jgi:hypothetical protein
MHPLERELQRLRPRTPPRTLKARIAAELEDRPQKPGHDRRAWRFLAATTGVAAAAAVLAGVLLWHNSGIPSGKIADVLSAPTAPNIYQPVSAERELIRAFDDGIVMLGSGPPMRQRRFHVLDHLVWENPADGSQYQLIQPLEQVVYTTMDVY